jgi:transcription antitermination factor NusG
MTAPYWCVARSEPQREATAASFLGKAGYTTYLPRLRATKSNHGRRQVVTPPLFPNYLFCRIELQWHAVRRTIGVAALIMSGDSPAPVADSIIDELRARERDGYVELPAPPSLRPGDAVRVISGRLAGLAGLYSGMRGADRVAVLLGSLGVAVLPAGSVERAGL